MRGSVSPSQTDRGYHGTAGSLREGGVLTVAQVSYQSPLQCRLLSSIPLGSYHYHMDEIITIDGAGRLVVPRAIRARLHLREGSRLRVREEGGNLLVLEPVGEASVPVDVDGLLVIRGQLIGAIPDHREQRAERIRALGRESR
jgi:AbrB family looped-hinge helix DNA binding protein